MKTIKNVKLAQAIRRILEEARLKAIREGKATV